MPEIIHAEHNCYHKVGNYIIQVKCQINERLLCVCVSFFPPSLLSNKFFLLFFFRLDYEITSEMVDAIGSTFNMPNK